MFRLLITSDSNGITGVADANLALANTPFYKFMENQDYGETLKGISVFFICRGPNLIFKQRIRHIKQSQKLYMDIMLNYDLFINLTPEERVSELCKKLLAEVPPIVSKYKFKDFDLDKFMNNLETWFKKHNYI